MFIFIIYLSIGFIFSVSIYLSLFTSLSSCLCSMHPSVPVAGRGSDISSISSNIYNYICLCILFSVFFLLFFICSVGGCFLHSRFPITGGHSLEAAALDWKGVFLYVFSSFDFRLLSLILFTEL